MTTPAAPAPRQKPIDLIAKGRTNVYWLPEDQIVFDEGFNVRIHYNIHELKESIRAQGIIEFCTGYMGEDKKFHLNDGHRRVTAVRALRAEGFDDETKMLIPVKPAPRWTTEAQRTLQILVHNSGEPLDMYEQALAMKRLVEEHGYDKKQISTETGFTIVHVTRCLELITNASPAVVKALEAGKISATTAADLVHELPENPAAQDAVITEALQNAAEAGSDTATAKHFDISLGKEAQHERKDAKSSEDPFAGKVTTPDTATTNHEGTFERGIERIPIVFQTKGPRKVELRVASQDGKSWFFGVQVAFPSLERDKGWVDIRPSVTKGVVMSSREEAIIAAMQQLHAELSLGTFLTKDQALLELDSLIQAAGAKMAAKNSQQASTSSTASTDNQEPGDSGAGAPSGTSGTTSTTRTTSTTSSGSEPPSELKLQLLPVGEQLAEILKAVERKDSVKERYDHSKKLLAFITGKMDAKLLTRWIMGIDD